MKEVFPNKMLKVKLVDKIKMGMKGKKKKKKK